MGNYQSSRICGCAHCRSRGLMGPAVLITLGVLLALNEFGMVSFHSTWPILLIVIGLVKVLAGNAGMTGHIDVNAPPLSPGPPSPGSQTGAAPSSEPGQVDHV